MIIQQGILDLLNTEDITNIKLGIILARSEGYRDNVIIKMFDYRPAEIELFASDNFFFENLSCHLTLKSGHRFKYYIKDFNKGPFSEDMIVHKIVTNKYNKEAHYKTITKFINMILEL